LKSNIFLDRLMPIGLQVPNRAAATL